MQCRIDIIELQGNVHEWSSSKKYSFETTSCVDDENDKLDMNVNEIVDEHVDDAVDVVDEHAHNAIDVVYEHADGEVDVVDEHVDDAVDVVDGHADNAVDVVDVHVDDVRIVGVRVALSC